MGFGNGRGNDRNLHRYWKINFLQKEISKMILYFAMAFFLFSFPRLSSGEERKFISYVGMEIRDDVKILFIDENS